MSVGAPCLGLIDMQERSISEGEDEMKVEGLKTLHPRKRARIRIKQIIEATVVTRRKPLVGWTMRQKQETPTLGLLKTDRAGGCVFLIIVGSGEQSSAEGVWRDGNVKWPGCTWPSWKERSYAKWSSYPCRGVPATGGRARELKACEDSNQRNGVESWGGRRPVSHLVPRAVLGPRRPFMFPWVKL
jgi:hypothetical protein